MLKARIVYLIIIVMCSWQGQAQIMKVDRIDVTADSSYWSGSVDFQLDVNNQSAEEEENATFVGTTLQADISFIGTNHLYKLINQLQYFSTGVGPFVSTGYGHFRIHWLRKKHFSYENFAQVQYDQGRNMKWRGLTGGGIKIRLFRLKKSYVHYGLGAMFEQERWTDFESNVIEKNLFKMTTYFGSEMALGKVGKVTTTLYYQTGYDADDAVHRNRISGDLNLEFEISEVLGFTSNFSLQYEDKPIIDINNIIYSITNGITLNF